MKVEIHPSFYKKIDKEIVDKAESVTIRNTTLKAEGDCKKEAPYKTGKLRRSHSSEISDEEGTVQNSAEYAVYVIHGTSKMDGNNYPQRVVNKLASEKYMSKTFQAELKKQGVFQ